MGVPISFSKVFLFLFIWLQVFISSITYITQPPINVPWNNFQCNATDIGVGAGGEAFIINLEGKLNYYNISDSINSLIDITPNGYLLKLTNVDVDSYGTPFVIDSLGNTLYLNCNKIWKALPGCAKDIGVGMNGDIWKIGCDKREGGYGVWNLICNKCKFKNNCVKFKSGKQDEEYLLSLDDEHDCDWYRVEGAGLRIDVDPKGNPWIVNSSNEIYHYDGLDWHLIPALSGIDISVSNEGVVFATGTDYSIRRLICPKLGTWQILSGSATNVSVGPYSLPFVIDSINGGMQTFLS
jgi:hypothetical protein